MHAPQKIIGSRRGFTLTELLVVIAIILFLSALVVAMLPSIASQTSDAQGAVNLQGWLNIARQKAVRNQSPYGLRLYANNTTTMWVTDCQYIEQPDDFTGAGSGTLTTTSTNVANDTAKFGGGVDLTGGLGADSTLWPVQTGDYLEVLGTGLMHSITAVDGVNQQVLLATATPFAINNALNWRIVRQPRAVGETLSMPTDVVIDLGTNNGIATSTPPWASPNTPPPPVANGAATNPLVWSFGNVLPMQPAGAAGGVYMDILFSPSGSVLSPQLSQSYIALWVRTPDTTTAPNASPYNVYAGTPTIIAVWGQTGLVGAYPPAQGNPYQDIR